MVIVLAMAPARTGPPHWGRPAAAPPAAGPAFRAHLIASPFGTIHAATFRFSQPVGTAVPAFGGLRLAAYTADGDGPLSASSYEDDWRREFPQVNRSRKSARLRPRASPVPDTPQPAGVEITGETKEAGRAPPPPPSATPPSATAAAGDAGTPGRAEAADADPALRDGDSIDPPRYPVRESATMIDDDGAMILMVRVYVATVSPAGMTPVELEPWPVEIWESLPVPPWPAETPGSEPPDGTSGRPRNETIAAKGEVTGADRRPKSPAELLDLAGPDRAKHEKCLADAVYFEARGEPVRGQMAVAQVVINRVFSGYYPDNVCGVVYQSTRRHRRLRCQFSFTCDGIPDRVTEPDAWERAKHIARDALDGNFWLDDIGKATHYHARWVYPRWVHEMRRLDRIGVHTFYRPRKWGDGAASPVWGDTDAKVEKL